MADMIPVICGKSKLHIPDRECTDCDRFEIRIERLEDWTEDADERMSRDETNLNTNYYNKVEVNELIAGITHGGGFKLVSELPDVGEPGYIYLVENTAPATGFEQYIWTDSGWADLGAEEITLDKQSILTALGYEEMPLTMIDSQGTSITRTILVAIE